MQNKLKHKAFTLTELLVTITIIGIIMMIAVPIIKNTNNNQEKQKYNTYHKSIEESARLYIDTYNRDIYENNEDGCVLLPLGILIEKNLAKDIQIENKSCLTENSFIKVEKENNRYAYKTYLSCGTKNADNTITIDLNISDSEANISTYLATCKKIEN